MEAVPLSTTTHLPRAGAEHIASDERIPQRRWLTIPQITEAFPAFSRPAIRSLIQRSRPHYDHRGEWVEGNGLASAICQLGGKNGKIMIDALAFARWLESWASAANFDAATATARDSAKVARVG
jgi:hypothetical protein